MDREQVLRDIFKDIDENKQSLISEVIENVVFLEKTLTELKKLPHIKVNPADSAQQKRTEAGKLYKDYLQQYTNCIILQLSEWYFRSHLLKFGRIDLPKVNYKNLTT